MLYGHLACFPVDDPALQVVFLQDPAWRRLWNDLGSHEELEMGLGPAWQFAMSDPWGWK